MAKPSVIQELQTIKQSLEDLSAKVSDLSPSVTAGEEIDYQSYASSAGTGQDLPKESKGYANLLIDAAISKTELKFEQKISSVQKEILGELSGLSNNIRDNKPRYFWIFISVFLASLLTLAAIFVPVIPIYTENVVNSKIKEMKTTIVDELIKIINDKLKPMQPSKPKEK